jgi:ribosomal-protein-alanine N-acetyltransferase
MTRVKPTVDVRRMRWQDIDAVVEIERLAFPATAWTAEMFWSELAEVPQTRTYFVATDAARVVGYAGLMTVGADADVQTIAVAASAQGAGVGHRLLDELVDEAVRRGCTRMFLEVAADNSVAQHLYERSGFEVTARRRGYYGPGADAVVMSRTLRQTAPA